MEEYKEESDLIQFPEPDNEGYKIYLQRVGEFLREKFEQCKKKGEVGTQKDLANKLKISEAYLSKVLNGQQIFSHSNLIKASQILHFDLGEIQPETLGCSCFQPKPPSFELDLRLDDLEEKFKLYQEEDQKNFQKLDIEGLNKWLDLTSEKDTDEILRILNRKCELLEHENYELTKELSRTWKELSQTLSQVVALKKCLNELLKEREIFQRALEFIVKMIFKHQREECLSYPSLKNHLYGNVQYKPYLKIAYTMFRYLFSDMEQSTPEKCLIKRRKILEDTQMTDNDYLLAIRGDSEKIKRLISLVSNKMNILLDRYPSDRILAQDLASLYYQEN